MSASVERVPHKPQESNEKDLIKNYLGNLKSAYQKKFFQNPGNASSIPRAEAERHLELVYKRQQSSPHKVKTLVDYKDDMIEGLDPFQVHDFICKKELQEIEANASKFKAPSRRNNDRRREHLMTTSSINPSIQHLESKQNQLLDINKRGESSHKNVNENPQMRAYTLSHKKGRQVVKSNGLCFLNQSLIGNLPDKSCSPIRFAGQSVNSSAINYEEGSESPLVSNNNSKMQQQNSRMKLQIRNSASNNLLAAIRKQNLRQNEKKKNEKLTQDSQPHQSQSEMSINLPDLKLNNDIKPIESNITNIEKEDIVFNPELEADTKEKEGIKTKTKPVIVQNQSELLRIKLEQVVLRNQARAKKPSTTLMNQIDAKLKLNKALNTSHRSMSVLNKNSKSHQNSSPNQLKSFGNDTFSLHLKNENFKEQTLKAGSEEKSDASPCYPKIRSQQETAKFSENHLKAYGLFAKNTTSVAHSSSQSPEIKKGSDLFGDCSPEDRRSILKKRSLLTKQEEVLITSQGELRTSGSITFDQNVRYQEFPKIASDQGITLIGGKRNSNFFKEGKGNSQLSTEHKTQESVDSRVLLKSLDKANSLSLAESKKSKAQNYQDITPQRRDVRYTSLEDDSPGGINRARNSLNLNSLVSFKNKDKMSESLIIEKAKCQSILNRSMDLSDDIHEIGYDIDKAMYTQGQRHEKVGDLLDILQKASYAHSGILQTVYHYNKANKLEYKNEQERMIKDYSDKKEREFVQKEIEEGKALKVRVRRALKRNIGRANKI